MYVYTKSPIVQSLGASIGDDLGWDGVGAGVGAEFLFPYATNRRINAFGARHMKAGSPQSPFVPGRLVGQKGAVQMFFVLFPDGHSIAHCSNVYLCIRRDPRATAKLAEGSRCRLPSQSSLPPQKPTHSSKLETLTAPPKSLFCRTLNPGPQAH